MHSPMMSSFPGSVGVMMSVPLSFGWRAQRTEMGREISGEGQKGVMCVGVCVLVNGVAAEVRGRW